MKTHTKLIFALVTALALSACNNDSNDNAPASDGFTAQVRALLGEMSEMLEPAQALFDRLVATEPETTEPEAVPEAL